MYGRRSYNKSIKPVEQPKVNNSIPTYICGKCKVVKNLSVPFSELSLIENTKLIVYTKVCGSCTELIKTWIR